MYRTGFCGTGDHEGTRPISPSGKARKVCTALEVCECECHKEISRMYEMSGLPRVKQFNPDYEPYVIDFWMPGLEGTDDSPVDDPSIIAGTITRGDDERVPTAIVAPVRGIQEGTRAFTPTPTGRRAKGLLEDEVRHICNLFMRGEVEGPLTPPRVALMIDEIEPPSVGAIDAVFKRWEALGFADVERKPVRFTGYSIVGLQKGLERMKEESRKKNRLEKAQKMRGATRHA